VAVFALSVESAIWSGPLWKMAAPRLAPLAVSSERRIARVDAEGFTYFRSRTTAAPSGAAYGLAFVVAPDGLVLPCHAARDLPGLTFWNVRERSLQSCWEGAPGMNALRGAAWMRELCRSCPERTRDFGGCRCQAYRLTGDAANTDPACALAPQRDAIAAARERAGSAPAQWMYRGG
jgi:pyrroloquinoline quinone biosynthesis protein E